MDREQARLEAKSRLGEYLQSYHGINTRAAFRCLNPEHEDRHPSMSLTKKGKEAHAACHCGAYYDIFDIVKIDYGLTDQAEIFKKTYELLNIEVDGKEENQKQDKNGQKKEKAAADQEEVKDFRDFFEKANKDIEKTDYHRGISLKVLNAYKVGYVENWRHPNSPKAPTSPRLIIPISAYSYIARDTRKNLTPEQEEYKKQKVKGKEKPLWIFNFEALEKSKIPIVVVEGEIDALSIIEAGGQAVAVGSISYIRQFMDFVKKHRPKETLILSLDNDKKEDGSNPGQKAEEELAKMLDEEDIFYHRFNVAGEYKDANEYLNADRAGFIETVKKAMDIGLQEKRRDYLKTSTAHRLQNFINGIVESKTAAYFPTGFPSMDNILDGGLYAGLYIVGAVSSLGKTTFCLQIMDSIAAQGQDVLVFSLEMSEAELIAKSISRHTLLEDIKQNQSTKNAKTTRGILTGSRYANYSQTERKIIENAVESYGEYAEHIYIHEGVGSIGVEKIREEVEKHITLTGHKPIVLIDYAQILAPYDIRATDKQNTDKNILELKRLSRDNSITIIGVSSFNRESYTDPVTTAAFKESGAIEYGADVLIGLQYEGMEWVEKETKDGRKKRIRELIRSQEEKGRKGQAQNIEVLILKNRNGSRGSAVLDFYPMFNLFTEKGQSGIEKEEAGKWKRVRETDKDFIPL